MKTKNKSIISNPYNKRNSINYQLSTIINPGNEYLLQEDDICIYIDFVEEENYDWKQIKPKFSKKKFLIN